METILTAILEAFSPLVVSMNFLGVLIGMIVGALPGLGSVVAITICLPFTFGMHSSVAIALLFGVYCGSVAGGSIASILLNTPGTPQAACTALDGHPMAKQGKAAQAIGWALAASICGGLLSCLVLILATPLLADFALKFGAFETFALILMGLTCISSVSAEAQVKGIAAGVLGLLLACVGASPFSSEQRFTFDLFALNGGIDLVAVIVGVFALSEVIMRAEGILHEKRVEAMTGGSVILPALREWVGRRWLLIKSSLIGTWVGIMPGTGAATAAFLAYGEAKRSSPRRDKFGTGEPDSIVAAESANNAVTGGALVPTLALGIPGDPITAILLATFTIHGLSPGVRLMTESPEVVYAAFVTLIIANIFLYPACVITTRLFNFLLRLPEPILMGVVVVLCALGAYGSRGNPVDVAVTMVAGIVAYFMRRNGYPMPPIVIGLVLGQQFELSVGQMLLFKGNQSWPAYILSSPLGCVLLLLALAVLAMPHISAYRTKRSPKSTPEECQP
ncbi:MAG: tripartite tricarboxylate transporter permease [Desulfovibrionaceae bacterium]|nr:tripartite tricarboxylate transporter permease [Desulfovibrionaceae bacterium]